MATLALIPYRDNALETGSVLEARSIRSAFDRKFLEGVSFQTTDKQEHRVLCRYSDRVIALSPDFDSLSRYDRLAYVAFELYNLAKATQFERIIESSSSVDLLVREIEFLEHQSALETQAFMRNHYGSDIKYELQDVDHDFESFYAMEQLQGHSQWLATKYLPHEKYQGTISKELTEMTRAQHETLYAILHAHHHNPELFETLRKAVGLKSMHDKSLERVQACMMKIFH